MTHPEKQPHIEPLQGEHLILLWMTPRIWSSPIEKSHPDRFSHGICWLPGLYLVPTKYVWLRPQPVVGFVQFRVLAGFGNHLPGKLLDPERYLTQREKDDAADIGSRLISTGYVVCFFQEWQIFWAEVIPANVLWSLQAHGMVLGSLRSR